MPITLKRDGSIAIITMDRPERHNALTGSMYADLAEHWHAIDEDPSIRVAILTGAGERAFSVGSDLASDDNAARDIAPDPHSRWEVARARDLDSGLEAQIPIIAAIEGYCIGGGLGMALACDIRVAGDSATFSIPEVQWNLLGGYSAIALPQVIGISNAMRILLTGERFDASEAHRMGLIQEVVPAGAALDRAIELARVIERNGPVAVQMTKELVIRSRDVSLAEGVRLYQALSSVLGKTIDHDEGIKAFREKRSPQFRGY